MIRIYFAGSIRGGRKLAETYRELIDMLRMHGEVYTEHVGNEEALRREDVNRSDRFIHDRDLEWLRNSDMVIAEVTVPSLGVGYEIAMAIELGKPVLCLFHKNSTHRLSAMISGSPKVSVRLYDSISEAGKQIEGFISECRERGLASKPE